MTLSVIEENKKDSKIVNKHVLRATDASIFSDLQKIEESQVSIN